MVRFHPLLLSTWIGSFAAVVHSISIVRFFKLLEYNLGSKHFIRKALRASGLPPKLINTIGILTWKEWCCIWLPFPQSILVPWCYPDVIKEENVTYMHFGRYNLKHLRMNVYRRSNVTNAPILIYIHGGGWMVGSRKHPPYSFVYQVRVTLQTLLYSIRMTKASFIRLQCWAGLYACLTIGCPPL